MNLAILMIASLCATGVFSQGVGDVVAAAANAVGNAAVAAFAATTVQNRGRINKLPCS